MRILILEDDSGRREVMSDCLQGRFPQYGVEYFRRAPDMIERMKANGLEDVILISLDHDLIFPEEDEELIDPGDGVDVASWLSQQSPVCPVIIQTTNNLGGDRMMERLNAAGWTTSRVVPYSDTQWIHERWRVLVRNAIVHGPKLNNDAKLSQPSMPVETDHSNTA